MKKLVLILVLVVVSQFAFSQTWNYFGNEKNVQIWYKWTKQNPYSNADDNYQLVIKLENESAVDKSVKISILFESESSKRNLGGETIKAYSTLSGWNGFSSVPTNGKTQDFEFYISVKDK